MMRNNFLSFIFILFIFGSMTDLFGQVMHQCPVYPGRDYTNPLDEKWLSAYDVKFYHIDIEADNQSTYVRGHVTMMGAAVRSFDTLVLELQDSLIISDIVIDSLFHPEIIHDGDAIYIPMPETCEAGTYFTSSVYYEGDAGSKTGFFSGISTSTDSKYNADVTYTLSEPQNAKDWFPVKQVLQDKIDSAWIDITCPRSTMAGSNGILEEVEKVSLTQHRFKWRTRIPMAFYLLSFTVADYEDYSFMAPLSEEGDSVLVQNYIYDNPKVLEDWEDDILRTGDLIHLYSELLIDYPFADEKYGHAMAPMGGGMEHQTMTTLSSFNFTLVAHELAHQWFGDYLTCGNWQDIWINEGFASYMEYISLEHLAGLELAREWMDQAMSIALSEKEGSVYVPAGDVENEFRLFSYSLSYKKGAILLHMIRNEINNDTVFFDALKYYLEAHGHGLATAEDFRSALETVSGMDFSCFFEQWYYGKGYPNFSISWYQQNDSLYIFSSQTTTSTFTPLFQVHFDIEVRGMIGDTRFRLYQTENENTFVVPFIDQVVDILFDQDNKILNSSSVRQQMPGNTVMTFWPNPFRDELYLRFRDYQVSRNLSITSMDGKEIIKYELEDNPVLLNLSELSDGPYFLVIREGERQITEKILKISEAR